MTVSALDGWTYENGMWNGPFPWDGYSIMVRMCARCGNRIELCNGCVKVGDILPALRGEPLTRFPRELCFFCAFRCDWDGESLTEVEEARIS